MRPDVTRVATVVLAGGLSTRMGEPKAWMDFEGEPLLSRVVRRCAAFSTEIVVVARRDQELPTCDARVVFDPIDGEGPLVGVLGGLRALGADRTWSFVVTTDAPFVDARVIEVLAERGRGHDAAVAVVDGKRHVLHALYGARAISVAEALVGNGERRASRLAEALDTRWVPEEELRADVSEECMRAFQNVNTPDELARARLSSYRRTPS